MSTAMPTALVDAAFTPLRVWQPRRARGPERLACCQRSYNIRLQRFSLRRHILARTQAVCAAMANGTRTLATFCSLTDSRAGGWRFRLFIRIQARITRLRRWFCVRYLFVRYYAPRLSARSLCLRAPSTTHTPRCCPHCRAVTVWFRRSQPHTCLTCDLVVTM